MAAWQGGGKDTKGGDKCSLSMWSLWPILFWYISRAHLSVYLYDVLIVVRETPARRKKTSSKQRGLLTFLCCYFVTQSRNVVLIMFWSARLSSIFHRCIGLLMVVCFSQKAERQQSNRVLVQNWVEERKTKDSAVAAASARPHSAKLSSANLGESFRGGQSCNWHMFSHIHTCS